MKDDKRKGKKPHKRKGKQGLLSWPPECPAVLACFLACSLAILFPIVTNDLGIGLKEIEGV